MELLETGTKAFKNVALYCTSSISGTFGIRKTIIKKFAGFNSILTFTAHEASN
jgi:hypothetical protein